MRENRSETISCMDAAPSILVVEAIRGALLDAAIAAYEDAGIQGLCAEGRWECAVQAIRGLDLTRFLTMLTDEKAEAEPLPPP